MKLKLLATVAAVPFVSGVMAADAWKLPPETARYKPGPGLELVIGNCTLCHSADYVSTQPPLTRAAWKATVEKMRLRYGAPISTNRTDAIVDYLTNAYGKETVPER
jgi:sulfite dehydrogenase (cytochrome) subunit B